jgi:photosystem II stability/assembly factor-like uncharacterized protein
MALTAAGNLPAADRLALEYFYDKDESALSLYGLGFADDRRGMAGGVLTENGRTRGAALVTSDGGRSWALHDLPAPAAWLYVDARSAWFGDGDRVWRSSDFGSSWVRARDLARISRVYFADAQRGWAIGWRDTVFATSDGGEHWRAVDTGTDKSRRDAISYADMVFIDGQHGLIAGGTRPARRSSRLPDWMDPAAAPRETPSVIVLLQTGDGGNTWTQSKASVFGYVSRISAAPDGTGLALIEFTGRFSYPSEVHALNLKTGASVRAFRREDRAVTDVALANGTAWLVAVEPPGQMLQAPIPGKLKLLRSTDLSKWTEIEADYRAVATRAVCAWGAGRLWVATDTGMLLAVRPGAE